MLGGRYSSSTGAIGIDFGIRGMHMLQLREQPGGLSVIGAAHNAGSFEAKPNPDHLTEMIRKSFASGGFVGRKCVISLPRDSVRVQSVRLPEMPDAELQQAAVWEASQRFGFDREQMEVAVLRTGASMQSGEGKEELILVAAAHNSINQWVDPVIQAGLRPLAIDTDFSAIARTLSRHCRRESDRAIVRILVHVGYSGSTVMILRGDQIAFCKLIDIGGKHMDRKVAEHLQLEHTAAAELRSSRIVHRVSEAGEQLADRATDRAVFESVRPLLGDLAKEVVLCMRYFGVTFRGRPPTQIVVTGVDGLEPHLDEMLAETAKIEVSHDATPAVLEPLATSIRGALGIRTLSGAEWSVAAGLSMRGIAENRRWRTADPEEPSRRGAAA